ncbi:MAG: penicillin acylase family protein, partial [Pseudomonadota bacterium]
MKQLLFFLFCLPIFMFGLIWGLIRFSTPGRKSFHVISEIKEPIRVDWDEANIPIIQSADNQDAYFAQGFITARDRFFQMELARRKMAGQLAEIFGQKALKSDLSARTWNYAKVAELAFDKMGTGYRESLISYSNGVNAFLRTQKPSWEFWVLRLKPASWRPEDSLLIVLSMYESLNRHHETDEQALSILREKLSPSAVSFLTLDWGLLDFPILKDTLPLSPPSSPTSNEFQVLEKQAADQNKQNDFEPGSNAWAMSGKLTESGKPLLASDPHLDLRVPNLWYRVGIKTPNTFVYGVTIPGIPGIVIGRNESVAWAFTNSALDNSDQVVLPADSKSLRERRESILIKDEHPHLALFTDSPWGPIIQQEKDYSIAVQWAALDPENLKQLDLTSINQARNTSELLEAFGKWAGPPQNAIFATQAGDIGWTIVGNLPRRIGFDGRSRTFRTKSIFWDGYVPRNEFPIVINPPDGLIVSANQRTVPVYGSFSKFGSHWPNSARAKRISQLLNSKQKWRASDFLQVQTDNLSLTHLWYRDAFLQCPIESSMSSDTPWLNSIYPIVQKWNGRTEINSSAYPLLKAFRNAVFSNLIGPIAKTISVSNEEVLFNFLSQDNLMFQLLQSTPRNFLS